MHRDSKALNEVRRAALAPHTECARSSARADWYMAADQCDGAVVTEHDCDSSLWKHVPRTRNARRPPTRVSEGRGEVPQELRCDMTAEQPRFVTPTAPALQTDDLVRRRCG
jgi:hypothetical protein